jgi:hypothetical protein
MKPVSLEALQQTFSYTFTSKPLLIGGAAMEYYGLRKRGQDIDFVITEQDYIKLEKRHPENKKDIFGDLGICKDVYEVWRTIMMFDFEHLAVDAVEYNGLLVASLEKMLLLKALAMSEEKYFDDLRLIVKKIINLQYENR